MHWVQGCMECTEYGSLTLEYAISAVLFVLLQFLLSLLVKVLLKSKSFPISKYTRNISFPIL